MIILQGSVSKVSSSDSRVKQRSIHSQNQIEQFEITFKDGSVVTPGGITYDSEYYSVKINPEYLGVPVVHTLKILLEQKL